MGVKGLLRELPGGDMKDQRVGFHTLDVLRGEACHPVDIDTGTLVFVCALRHKVEYNSKNYVPAARDFQNQLIPIDLIHKKAKNCTRALISSRSLTVPHPKSKLGENF